MKRLVFLILLCGCHQKDANVPQQPAQKAPCAPDLNKEFQGKVPATITERNSTNADWGETHEASCPKNMREVTPSLREIEAASADDTIRWIDEHEYCIPDGVKP